MSELKPCPLGTIVRVRWKGHWYHGEVFEYAKIAPALRIIFHDRRGLPHRIFAREAATMDEAEAQLRNWWMPCRRRPRVEPEGGRG